MSPPPGPLPHPKTALAQGKGMPTQMAFDILLSVCRQLKDRPEEAEMRLIELVEMFDRLPPTEETIVFRDIPAAPGHLVWDGAFLLAVAAAGSMATLTGVLVWQLVT